ncbi:MAG TPA: hypothetical protein VD837_03680 [Terriglobales bacterium]|nr:hypothetical protein [Terriglobales bacterium]
MSGPNEKAERLLRTTGPKMKYRKPEFEFEKIFETMALACGKAPKDCKRIVAARHS